jgi:hypothetical protein
VSKFISPVGALVIFVIAAVASPAAAQPTASGLYAEASQLAGEGRYDQALEVIGKGLELDPDHIDLRRLRGEVMLQKRDFEGALAAYERFLEANPRGANRRKAAKIVRDLQAVKRTFVHLKVDEGPATVYIDSKTLGVFCVADPECKKGMLPGSYELIIERDGFVPERVDLQVELNKTARLEKALVAKPSILTVTTRPADAQVSVDGKPVAPGQQEIEVAPGDHVVTVTAPGFAAAEKKVTAARGEPVALEMALPERIPVTITPEGAALTLDGEPIELEGGVLEIPADGADHVLVARAEGYQDATHTIAASRAPGQGIALALTAEVAANPVAVADVRVVSTISKRKMAAAYLVGAASVGVGMGAFYGLRASDNWQASKEFCDDNVVCSSQQGFDLVADAQRDARNSNIAFAISGGVAAIAAVLWLTAPSDDAGGEAERGPPAVSVGAGAGGVNVSLGGQF